MNKKFRKITGIVTTGALVLTLGAGAMAMNNTSVYAASIDDQVQTEEGTFLAGRRGGRLATQEGFTEGQRPERLEGLQDGERLARQEGIEGNRVGGPQGQGKQEKRQMDLTALVDAGLLDDEQVAAIELLKEEKVADMEETKALVQAMSEEERQTFFEEKKAEEKATLFNLLVEEGIITEAEAEAIESYLATARLEVKSAAITTKLEPLLTDGTISSADLDTIIEYLSALEPQERTKPVEGEDVVRLSPFDDMVSESLITQEQADAIEALMKPVHKGRR